MKLFIPELKTQLTLSKNTKVRIKLERRNEQFLCDIFPEFKKLKRKRDALSDNHWDTYYNLTSTEKERVKAERGLLNQEMREKFAESTITLKKGTVLEVDRIYIRAGNEDYSSITFIIRDKGVSRFWLPLDDVNKLEVDKTGKYVKYPNGIFSLCDDKGEYPKPQGRHNLGLRHQNLTDKKTAVCVYSLYNKDFIPFIHGFASNWKKYDSLDKLIKAAQRRNFPEVLITAFLEKMKNEPSQK